MGEVYENNIYNKKDIYNQRREQKSFTTGGITGETGTILIGCDDRLNPEIIQELGLIRATKKNSTKIVGQFKRA